MNDAFATPYDELPLELPVFPLAGVILLPGAQLPLNIFEPRYVNLTLDCLGRQRLFGVLQPRQGDGAGPVPPLHGVGCAGRITAFTETEDGRLLIVLLGIIRFRVVCELAPLRDYRRVRADYAPYRSDLERPRDDAAARERLWAALRRYAAKAGAQADLGGLEGLDGAAFASAVAMNMPFDSTEKQALVEARDVRERSDLLVALLDLAARGGGGRSGELH